MDVWSSASTRSGTYLTVLHETWKTASLYNPDLPGLKRAFFQVSSS